MYYFYQQEKTKYMESCFVILTQYPAQVGPQETLGGVN